MNPQQVELWLEIQHRQMLALEKIAITLERFAPANTAAPNYTHSLDSFNRFNWESIGAAVVQSDSYGAAIVSWRGQHYIRRSPSNKFGEAIWFSRCTGKGEDGNNLYERLITFKRLDKIEVDVVPEKTWQRVTG